MPILWHKNSEGNLAYTQFRIQARYNMMNDNTSIVENETPMATWEKIATVIATVGAITGIARWLKSK